MRPVSVRPIIVLSVACVLTVISAVMNVSGYISLYQQSSIIISLLFISLEITKATIFGIVFLIGNRVQKSVLLIFAILLVIISFLGHLSFLSSAYNVTKAETVNLQEISKIHKESYDEQIASIDNQIENIKTIIERNNLEFTTIQKNIEAYSSANSKNWVYTTNKKRMKELSDNNNELNVQLSKLYFDRTQIIQNKRDTIESITDTNNKIAKNSVFDYTAKIFNITTDTLSTYINLILAVAIDPIALTLLWTGNSLIFSRPRIPYEEFKDEDEETITDSSSVYEKESENTPITIYNCDEYTYKGYTLSEFVKLDADSINEIRKSAINNKRAREWITSCMSVRHNKNLFYKSKAETKREIIDE